MDDDLPSIGRFARLAGLSVGALRHDDELDLLRPADIARLRDLELPLERSGRSWRWTTRPSSGGGGRRPTGPESRREPTD